MVVEESIEKTLIFLVIITLITNYIGWKFDFYKIQNSKPLTIPFKQAITILVVFSAYLWIIPYLTLLIQFSKKSFFLSSNTIATIAFCMPLILVVFLIFYSIFSKNSTFKNIWKTPSPSSTILNDIFMGIGTTILALPTVVCVVYFFHLILLFTNLYDPSDEQNAIFYLKQTLSSPLKMSYALSYIVLLAPIMEEFIFRGTLQTYLKQHLNKKTAIILTSVCFAFFHFSTNQKTANIPIISSLFVFGCFSGIVYEKQRSLYSSITLHSIFNLVNTIRIILI